MNLPGPLNYLLQGRVEIFLLLIGGLLVSLTVHEVGHALVAYRLGDVRKEQRQRITLNPIRHVDPFGAIVFLITGFGWAKPVAVNPTWLKGDWWRSMALVAAAGPLMNLLLAVIAALVLRFADGAPDLVTRVLLVLVLINVGLAVFNLLPIPVLDGYKVIQGVLPGSAAYQLSSFEARYGFGVLALIVVLSYFSLPFLGSLNVFSLVVSPIARLILDFLLAGTGRL